MNPTFDPLTTATQPWPEDAPFTLDTEALSIVNPPGIVTTTHPISSPPPSPPVFRTSMVTVAVASSSSEDGEASIVHARAASAVPAIASTSASPRPSAARAPPCPHRPALRRRGGRASRARRDRTRARAGVRPARARCRG